VGKVDHRLQAVLGGAAKFLRGRDVAFVGKAGHSAACGHAACRKDAKCPWLQAGFPNAAFSPGFEARGSPLRWVEGTQPRAVVWKSSPDCDQRHFEKFPDPSPRLGILSVP